MKLDELCHDSNSLISAHILGIIDAGALKLSEFGGCRPRATARKWADISARGCRA